MQESVIERYLCKQVKRVGGECIKLQPPPKGIQDRLVILPGGYLVFVELKRPQGGVLSQIQVRWAERMLELGQRAIVLNTKTGVDAFIKQWAECYGTTSLSGTSR